MKKRTISFILSIISGIFLILSGTNGVSFWTTISELILKYFDIKIIKIIFSSLIIIASFGGILVIIGGFLIYKRKIRFGRLIIAIGTGAGLVSLLLNIFLMIITEGILIELFLSFSTLGIILSILARRIVKPRIKHYFRKKWKKLFS